MWPSLDPKTVRLFDFERLPPPDPPDDIPPQPDTLTCNTYFDATPPYLDPGCPPQLGRTGHDEVVDAVVELIRLSLVLPK